jgi:hypothetical protein
MCFLKPLPVIPRRLKISIRLVVLTSNSIHYTNVRSLYTSQLHFGESPEDIAMGKSSLTRVPLIYSLNSGE